MFPRLAAIGLLTAIVGGQQLPPPLPDSVPGQRGPQFPRVPQAPFPGGPIPGTSIPGGPVPGTTYPGGGSPPVIDTIPLPRTGGGQAPRSSGVAPREILVNEGLLRHADRERLILEAFDHRVIWYRISDNIAVDRGAEPAELEDFTIGDHLRVESIEDDRGYYAAVRVYWLAAGSEEERAAAGATWDLPKIAIPEEDRDERPVLRRGPRPSKEQTAAVPVAAPADEPPARAMPEQAAAPDPVLDRVRQAGEEFVAILPSFAVRQLTTRYINQPGREDWRALDLVAARLIYRAGIEDYQDITIDNKPVDAKLEDIDGLRSTGEFSSILEEILNPLAGARFSRLGEDQLRNRRAWKYRYEIPRERSRWRVFTPSEVYYPAYRGSLWIDAATYRVLRLEQEAAGIPVLYPFDKVEIAVDYDVVRLDAGKDFLLPVEAAALYCIRSTSVCRRNLTVFRNYVKFDAESDIRFPDLQ